MNRTITSKDAILAASKELVIESGMLSLNIRDVARRCGVAVGSVYNYFPSKEDLVVAAVESIWTEIMHQAAGVEKQASFAETVQDLFERVRQGSSKYPFFLNVHAMSFGDMEKNKGREVMSRYFQHIERGLLESLDRDPKVRPGVFTEAFTRSAYVSFVFANILNLILNQKTNCDFLLAIIQRTIYD